MRVNLYTTVGCHLCEEALVMLQRLQGSHAFDICEVEISESESLMDRYGIRIPVIAVDGGGTELGWPFNVEQLEAFIIREEQCRHPVARGNRQSPPT